MKHLRKFNEAANISKNRKFPTLKETRGIVGRNEDLSDEYYIYKLNKDEVGKYLNTWFEGQKVFLKKNRKINPENESDENIVLDELWTVKRVDEETSRKLYNKYINPVSLNIRCTYPPNTGKLFSFTAKIHSIDDSSFTAYFSDRSIDECRELRDKFVKYFDSFIGNKYLNGHKFFEFAEELGCNETNTD